MQIILQNTVFNDSKLKSYITKLTVNELNELSTPCYYPDWKRHYYELLSYTNLKEKDIKDFVKRFYSGTKAQDALLQSEVGSNLLVILMYHFLEKKDQQTYSTILIYHMIRQYGNFIRRVLPKYCKPEVFSYTLDHLNPTHLFSREKTIANAIFHLSNELNKRYTQAFLELDPEKVSSFLYESRGRIAQSLRSFAEAYYKNEKEGLGLGSEKEFGDEEVVSKELEKTNRIAELISDRMCVYKEIDYKAFNQAKMLTKINTSYATLIANSLKNTSYKNDIKFLVELFFKDLKSMDELCGNDFFNYVKKLMSIKRTSKAVYFKQEINTLMEKIIKNTAFEAKYKSLTNQTQFQINSFLAYYISISTRNLAC